MLPIHKLLKPEMCAELYQMPFCQLLKWSFVSYKYNELIIDFLILNEFWFLYLIHLVMVYHASELSVNVFLKHFYTSIHKSDWLIISIIPFSPLLFGGTHIFAHWFLKKCLWFQLYETMEKAKTMETVKRSILCHRCDGWEE